MDNLSAKLIVVTVILTFSTYLGLLVAHLYIKAKNKKLMGTKRIEDLSRGMLRELRKHNYSREAIVQKLKSKETRLVNTGKLIKVSVII